VRCIIRVKKEKIRRLKKISRAQYAVAFAESCLAGARSIQDKNGNQVWVVMFTPELATHVCSTMGWELSLIGRDSRDLLAGEITEKEQQERRIVLPWQ
jgi:hypothetical protein